LIVVARLTRSEYTGLDGRGGLYRAQLPQPILRLPETVQQGHIRHIGDPGQLSLYRCLTQGPATTYVQQQRAEQVIQRVESSEAGHCAAAPSQFFPSRRKQPLQNFPIFAYCSHALRLQFFDRVNHDKLMGQIAKRVADKRLLKLIRAFLNAGVMENGLVSPSVEGTPQGGPLSPLLSNLVLDELDRELERRGLRFVRYADDCNLYVRSERAGQRVMESITRCITQKLKLKVNEAKSAVARPQERKFLGFSFTSGPEVKRIIALKALKRFKKRIREITRRAKSVSIRATMAELIPYLRGWRGYFGFCETPAVLVGLIRWVRLRLRAALWRQWKTPRRRRAALLQLGVRPRLASNTASSGLGPWYLAYAQALSIGLSNAYFQSLGPSFVDE
jgi:hypothetical protein